MVLVSVIIPNFNGEKYLLECIRSIEKQAYKSLEIIVVDNGSRDKSRALLEALPYGLIKNKENMGFAYAVNQGIKEAKGKYILLFNNDAMMTEDFVTHMVQAIQKDKQIFSVSSKMLQYRHKDRIDDAGDEYNLLGWAYQRGNGSGSTTYMKEAEIFSACAGAAIYRKSLLEKVGLFETHFFAYMEDVDIGYRARLHGYKNVYCPKAICYHVGSATSGSRYNAFKVKLAARNNIYVVYKNMPLLQMVLNGPFLMLGFFIKYLFFLRKGLGDEYLKGLKEGLSTLDKVKKVPYESAQLWQYLKIEGRLIRNTVAYLIALVAKRGGS